VFYNTDADYVTKWKSRGIVAFEMEASALFFLAARAQGSGKDVRAGCILTVSDTLGPKDESVGNGLHVARGPRGSDADALIEIALEAGTSLAQ